MCPPGPSPLTDIGAYWTDEELILFLDRIQHGSPLPNNVLVDVNPFEHKPLSLPDDIWYFVLLDNEKETETRNWKASGDSCQIYEDSKLTGWRSTLEFHEGTSDDGHRIDSLMLKYWITHKETHSLKDSGYLCRVFPCDGEYRMQKRQRHVECVIARGQERLLEEEHDTCDSRNGPTEVDKVNVSHDNTKSSNPGESLDDLDCFSKGDYLELLDLVNPRTSTSTSDSSTSSCVSMASDEVFDYLALLNDLDPENSKEIQSSSSNYHLSVSTSSIPKVVVSPATCGSLVIKHDGCSPGEPLPSKYLSSGLAVEGKPDDKSATAHAGQNHKYVVVNYLEAPASIRKAPDKGKRPDDRSTEQGAQQDSGGRALKSQESSSSQRTVTDKGKKHARGKMKMLKMCFPF